MVSAMSSQPRRSRGATTYENADDGSAHENNSLVKSVASNNMRRRRNTTIASNGQYRVGRSPERKNDGEPDLKANNLRANLHPLPKSLTPFVHINDTKMIDVALDAYSVSSRSPPRNLGESNGVDTDIEAANGPQNRTISIDTDEQYHSFHGSNLSTDSFMEFNNSRRSIMSDGNDNSGLFNDLGNPECSSRCTDEIPQGNKKGKRRLDQGSIESSISFRSQTKDSFEGENGDEQALSDQTGTDSSSNAGSPSNQGQPSTLQILFQKFQLSRRIVGRFVNNEFVQLVFIFLIVVNAILMGISTSDSVKESSNVDFDRVDKGFLWVFTVEIALQFYYYGLSLFLDWWLVFDLVVVGLSHMSEQFQVVRAFRIFRAFRLITRVRPLRDLVMALGEVLPRMSAIVALLGVTFYVFAVLFTELYSDVELSQPFFENLGNSLFTLFQMMTMEWADICRELMLKKPEAWFPIICFVMLAGFIVFNLIVAVVVEAVAATEETVRRLDGIESNTPASKLQEAEERVDLLQSHLNEMMDQQEQIQSMLEAMAGELLHMETERMKAKYRENRLREEINRRIEYQKKIEEGSADGKKPESDAVKNISMQFLKKIEASKLERKQKEENQADLQSLSDQDSIRGGSSSKKKILKASWIVKPDISRDASGKSLVTNKSADSIRSNPNHSDSPNQRGTSRKRTESTSQDTSHKGKPKGVKEEAKKRESEPPKTDDSDKKKRAINKWKKLIAVNKEINL